MAGFIGCGKLYLNRVVDGSEEGWKELGNATQFSITENAELLSRSSRQCDTYGQTLDAVSIKGETNLAVTLDDVDEALVYSLLGTESTVNVTGSTVTAEQAFAKLGASLQAANREISAVVVKDQPGTTTYTENTDYVIENAQLGLIKILATGTITDGEELQLDYTYASYSSQKITGGTDSSIKGALMLVGHNLARPDEGLVINAWDATLTPANGADFLSEEFVSLELNGLLVTDATRGNAYEVEKQVQ